MIYKAILLHVCYELQSSTSIIKTSSTLMANNNCIGSYLHKPEKAYVRTNYFFVYVFISMSIYEVGQ